MATQHIPSRPIADTAGRALRGAAKVMSYGAHAAAELATVIAAQDARAADADAMLLTRSEGADLLDKAARDNLDISGAEFMARWDAGEYPDPDNSPDVMRVAMLLPLAR